MYLIIFGFCVAGYISWWWLLAFTMLWGILLGVATHAETKRRQYELRQRNWHASRDHYPLKPRNKDEN